MVANMAHSPGVLAGYLGLSRAMKRAQLDRKLSEQVSIAVQARLRCQTCLDAHIEAARRVGVTDEEIVAARTASSSDPRVAALLQFGMKVLSQPSTVADDDIVGLLAHGYSEQEVLDVVQTDPPVRPTRGKSTDSERTVRCETVTTCRVLPGTGVTGDRSPKSVASGDPLTRRQLSNQRSEPC